MKILCFAGSARKESLNKALASFLSEKLNERSGVDSQFIDLADYEMPIYNGDLEAECGLPESAVKLKQLFRNSDALLIACPEYNSSVTPLLKNTLDWVSRPGSKDEPRLSAYQGKKAALVAASPGALGGLRGLGPVRSILSNIGVWVCPTQLAVPKAHEILKSGMIEDSHTLNAISNLIDDFTG